MDSIVDFKIFKSTIRGKIPWKILILGNIVHWFWKYCIALGEGNKSDDLDAWFFLRVARNLAYFEGRPGLLPR